MGTKQKISIGIVVVALIGISSFLFLSRPLPAPTEMTADSLDTGDANSILQEGEVVYVASSGTTATFEIDETLNGKPKHVVGTTSDVQGQVTFNTIDPSLSKLGIFKVNARTLKTDEARRDNTVGRIVLKSADNANEFIIFEANGVKEMSKVGDELTFKIPGKLTVAGVTKDVTFSGTATVKEQTMNGTVSATILYKDFGIEIPNLPIIAWVDESVKITINFIGKTI
ncbi:MAG: YceI family protein [Candidatus Magasanikbacteria bacterium]|nr:YceI family protein [Candidatus Magasanikbacteria bacterium]